MSIRWFLLCCLIAFTTTICAEAYKWVDENGVVSYSQTPPPSGTADTVIPLPPAPQQDPNEAEKRLDSLRQQLEDRDEDRQLAKESDQKKAAEQARRKQNCQAARSNLRELDGLGNRLLHTSDGQYLRLTEEERQTRMQTARDNIESNCSR